MTAVAIIAAGLILIRAAIAAADRRMCRWANDTGDDDD